jgi:hypothetical protein
MKKILILGLLVFILISCVTRKQAVETYQRGGPPIFTN